MEFHEKLLMARKQKKIGQAEAARRADMSHSQFNRIENGHIPLMEMKLGTIELLCQAVGLIFLFRFHDGKNSDERTNEDTGERDIGDV